MYLRSLPGYHRKSSNHKDASSSNGNSKSKSSSNKKNLLSISLGRSMSEEDLEDPDDDSGKKSRSSPVLRSVHRLSVRFRMLPRMVQFVVAVIGTSCFLVVLPYLLVAIANGNYNGSNINSNSNSNSNSNNASFFLGKQHQQQQFRHPLRMAPRIIQIIDPLDPHYVIQRHRQQQQERKQQERKDNYDKEGLRRQRVKSQLLTHVTTTNLNVPDPGTRELLERYNPLPHLMDIPRMYPPEPLDKEPCYHMAEWQTDHKPTCNSVHEASSAFTEPFLYYPSSSSDQNLSNHAAANPSDDQVLENLRLVAGGAFRHVWMMREYDGTPRAVKTLRVDRKSQNYDLRAWDRHRRDAVSMDQLGKSPLIVDIFSYCTNTGIFHWGEGGDLTGIFKRDPDISSRTLLHIAYNVSMSIAHAHNYDALGRPTLAHTDIKADQFLYQDGYYKLTDFNRVRFLRWNPTTDQQCKFDIPKNGGIWRSPEEYDYQEENEKVDVYSLGNVLYFLLTKKVPWFGVHSNDVYEAVKRGERPPIPKHILNSADPFHKYTIQAIKMCFEHDPDVRSSAKEVALKLQEGFDEL